MKISMLLFCLALPMAPSLAQETRFSAESDGLMPTDVLDRIERFRRLDAESAELILDGLGSLRHPLMQLESGLLLIYGPLPVRDRQTGLRRLNDLLASNPDEMHPDSLRLLCVIVGHVTTEYELKNRLEEMAQELQSERDAHEQVRETLEALRKIDRTLETESQSEDESGPDAEDDPPDDGGRP